MKTIVVTVPVRSEHIEKLEDAAPGCRFLFLSEEEAAKEKLEDAEIIFGNVAPETVRQCRSLKLLQLNSAGAVPYTKEGVLPEGAVLACATGAYGLALAEHMLGMLLAMKKKLYLYRENQKNHLWQDEGSVTGIYGTRTLIVGYGNIGREFAKRMKAMGSFIVGIRRSEGGEDEFADELYTMSELDEQLPLADIVFLSLPGTPETDGLMGERRLGAMKPGAYLMNVGRGGAVDSDALCRIMARGHLAGAALDVTDPEPLPPEHPLWEAENVVITPHISGEFHMKETLDRIVEIGADNIRRFLSGKPLNNVVDMKLGYRKRQGQAQL